MSKRNSFYNREVSLLCRYNLTVEAFEALSQAQNHKCKICGMHESDNVKSRQLYVDHDHKTGEIRGLLCNGCNLMLGNARENPTILLKGIQYLKRRL